MTSPWSNQAISLIILTEQTSGFSGIFGYSPTVGLGNLIFSISADAGTDPYGNTYPAGLDAVSGLGIQTYTQGTAPSGTIVTGSIWVDTAQGNSIYIWSGSAWVAYTLGTQAITPGSITATLLSAGIIVAGIVNGTTITGGTLVADGANGGIFVYSSTPANGNLIGSWAGMAGTDGEGNSYPQGLNVTVGNIAGTTITAGDTIINSDGIFVYSSTPANGDLVASIAQAPGSDAFGNTYVDGIATYDSGIIAQLVSGVLSFFPATSPYSGGQIDSLTSGVVQISSGLVSGGDTSASLLIQSESAGGVGSPQILFNANMGMGGTYEFGGPAGSGPFIGGESFHDISNGSVPLARVKLTPWNAVWLDVQGTWTGTTTIDLGTLPGTLYYPTTSRQFPMASNSSSAQNARVFVPTSGGLQVLVSGSNTAGAGGCSVMYPNN